MDVADAIVCPPTPCPARYQAGVNQWGEEVKTLFNKFRVPWSIQAGISHETTSSLVDLANRFSDAADVVASIPADLAFTQNTGSWTANHFRAAMSHMKEVWETAKLTRDSRRLLDARASERDPTHTMVPGQRESMERAYKAIVGDDPDPEQQGSDCFLGRLHRDVAKGKLGTYTSTEITSLIPEPHVILKKVTKQSRSSDNTLREHDVEVRDPPYTMEQWKRQMRVWVTSLLMAIYSHPHQTHLHIKKSELDDFYEWLWGPDVMGRESPPTLKSMMYAERLAWGRISVMIHKKVTLQDALKKMQENQMFWSKEVSDRCPRTPPAPPGKGSPWTPPTPWTPPPPKGKGRVRSRTPRQSGKGKGQWRDPAPPPPPPPSWGGGAWDGGRSKSKGKNKQAKGAGKQSKWVSTNMKGEQYCWAWNGGNCNNQHCTRIHRCCAAVGKTGQGCNKQHQAIHHH